MGRRRLPPLTAADFLRMLKADDWYEIAGGRHRNFKHPTKPGKVQVSGKWTGVKTGSLPFKGVCAQAGWTRDDVDRLYFG